MGSMKKYKTQAENLAPLWRRLRRAKTAKTQAKIVWEASGLIDDMLYEFMPNARLVGFNTDHKPINILKGFAAEMTKLGSKDHE